MKNIKLKIKKQACEVMLVELTGEYEDGVKFVRELNFSGNATSTVLYGARLVLDALAELEAREYQDKFQAASQAFAKLKSLTKAVPAGEWTPEYRALAEAIHNMGREVFYVE